MNNANAGLKSPGQLIIYNVVCVYLRIENIITGSLTSLCDDNNCAKKRKISYARNCICIFFFFQNVLNRRLEERTDDMVKRGLVDELCEFKNELAKKTGTNK